MKRKKNQSPERRQAEEDKKLYYQEGESKGYLNIPWLMSLGTAWIIIIGGRGTGKTYGVLQEAILNEWNFIFLRRLGKQLDIVKKPDYSPFKKLNKKLHTNITTFTEGTDMSGIYQDSVEDDNGNLKPSGKRLGFMSALNVFQNVRGFDGDDYEYVVYDEFVPQKNERLLKGEADAIFNMYETVNRNRELEGRPPVQMLMLSNSDDITHPIFIQLKLVKILERMKKNGKEVYVDRDRSITVVYLQHSTISEQKKEKTVIGRLTRGTSYGAMAYDNTFDVDLEHNISSERLVEYKPLVSVGELCIYKHKSQRNRYYVSSHKSGSPREYSVTYSSLERFRRHEGAIIDAFYDDYIIYEDFYLEALLEKYIKGI